MQLFKYGRARLLLGHRRRRRAARQHAELQRAAAARLAVVGHALVGDRRARHRREARGAATR